MERLPGVDAGFLYLETPTLHMHTLKIGVLDVSGIAELSGPEIDLGKAGLAVLRDQLGRRLHLLPTFRRRVVQVPWGLNHPVWVEDGAFDLDRHLATRRVPAPGGPVQVDEVIADIASTALPRDRPLWSITLLDGLADRGLVVVAKVHHALADGVAAAGLLAAVMVTDPTQREAAPPAAVWSGETLPARRDLLRQAVRDWAGPLRALPTLLLDTARRLRSAVAVRRTASVRPPRPILDTPRASFNGALTTRRTFATGSLPLDGVRRVARGVGVSVNDVVLALVSAALRQWLAARGERLRGSLTASVPVAADPPGSPARLVGNRVSSLFTSLCSDVADPVERLRRIHQVTVQAKAVQQALGLDLLERWVQYTPGGPFGWAMRQYSRLRGADLHRPPVNLVVSNVPGPREPLYVAGARLADLFSVGPILEGIGLNITVWSYCDRMNVSAISCPTLLPDLRVVVDAMAPALDELLAALPGSAPVAGPDERADQPSERSSR